MHFFAVDFQPALSLECPLCWTVVADDDGASLSFHPAEIGEAHPLPPHHHRFEMLSTAMITLEMLSSILVIEPLKSLHGRRLHARWDDGLHLVKVGMEQVHVALHHCGSVVSFACDDTKQRDETREKK